MSDKKKNQNKSVVKEKMQKAITEKLQVILGSLKYDLTEKKINKRIKKAAKLLTGGIKKIPAKQVISLPKNSMKRRKETVSAETT